MYKPYIVLSKALLCFEQSDVSSVSTNGVFDGAEQSGRRGSRETV